MHQNTETELDSFRNFLKCSSSLPASPSSPELKPVDNLLWTALQQLVYQNNIHDVQYWK